MIKTKRKSNLPPQIPCSWALQSETSSTFEMSFCQHLQHRKQGFLQLNTVWGALRPTRNDPSWPLLVLQNRQHWWAGTMQLHKQKRIFQTRPETSYHWPPDQQVRPLRPGHHLECKVFELLWKSPHLLLGSVSWRKPPHFSTKSRQQEQEGRTRWAPILLASPQLASLITFLNLPCNNSSGIAIHQQYYSSLLVVVDAQHTRTIIQTVAVAVVPFFGCKKHVHQAL